MAIPLRWLIAALVAVTALRLLVAAVVPLAPDEAYYWVWSQALQPGYLDHPPMVALWIRAGTLLAGRTALGVRLLGPLSAALAGWLLFDAAQRLFAQARPAVVAVLLLNSTLLVGVGAVIMTPDSPLLFFWIVTLWAVTRIAPGSPGGGGAWWWLLAGVGGGLALDSKYTALLLWVGIGLWLLLVPAVRPWLRRWQPWVAIGLGLALFAPVLAWNAAHRWAGLLKQGGRVEDWQPSRVAGFVAELVGSQVGLATPLVFVLCMAGLAAAWRRTAGGGDNTGGGGPGGGDPGGANSARRSIGERDPCWSLLLALSLPPILVFLQHALGDRVQGNWPAIIYPALSIAAGGVAGGAGRRGSGAAQIGQAAATAHAVGLDNAVEHRAGPDDGQGAPAAQSGGFWASLWPAAVILGAAVTGVAYLQATTGILPLPSRLDPIASRLSGWDTLARQTEAIARTSAAGFIAIEGYAPASELAWHLRQGPLLLGDDPHWTTISLPHASGIAPGTPGLLLRDARAAKPDAAAWPDAEWMGSVERPAVIAGRYSVFRVTAGPAAAAAVILPRR